MARDAFFQRVRQATQAGRAYRSAPHGEVTDSTGYVGGDDLCASFAAEVEAVGGTARVVGDFDAARAVVADWVGERKPTSALVWRHDVLAKLRLAELLAELGIAVLDHDALAAMPRQSQRTMALSADVGITSADFAVAETGTLAMFARPGQQRLASLAPPCHIAIVERRQIVPDLFDLFTALHEAGLDKLPSNVTLIAGPSKTGDIELQLTTGVHGPGDWRVIVVDA